MFRKGDVVERTTDSLEGSFKKGTRAIVEALEGRDGLRLDGHEGIYKADRF